ncbi:hypothetical protein Tco_0347271 [Tanacetum coccineum]
MVDYHIGKGQNDSRSYCKKEHSLVLGGEGLRDSGLGAHIGDGYALVIRGVIARYLYCDIDVHIDRECIQGEWNDVLHVDSHTLQDIGDRVDDDQWTSVTVECWSEVYVSVKHTLSIGGDSLVWIGDGILGGVALYFGIQLFHEWWDWIYSECEIVLHVQYGYGLGACGDVVHITEVLRGSGIVVGRIHDADVIMDLQSHTDIDRVLIGEMVDIGLGGVRVVVRGVVLRSRLDIRERVRASVDYSERLDMAIGGDGRVCMKESLVVFTRETRAGVKAMEFDKCVGKTFVNDMTVRCSRVRTDRLASRIIGVDARFMDVEIDVGIMTIKGLVNDRDICGSIIMLWDVEWRRALDDSARFGERGFELASNKGWGWRVGSLVGSFFEDIIYDSDGLGVTLVDGLVVVVGVSCGVYWIGVAGLLMGNMDVLSFFSRGRCIGGYICKDSIFYILYGRGVDESVVREYRRVVTLVWGGDMGSYCGFSLGMRGRDCLKVLVVDYNDSVLGLGLHGFIQRRCGFLWAVVSVSLWQMQLGEVFRILGGIEVLCGMGLHETCIRYLSSMVHLRIERIILGCLILVVDRCSVGTTDEWFTYLTLLLILWGYADWSKWKVIYGLEDFGIDRLGSSYDGGRHTDSIFLFCIDFCTWSESVSLIFLSLESGMVRCSISAVTSTAHKAHDFWLSHSDYIFQVSQFTYPFLESDVSRFRFCQFSKKLCEYKRLISLDLVGRIPGDKLTRVIGGYTVNVEMVFDLISAFFLLSSMDQNICSGVRFLWGAKVARRFSFA